MPYDGPDEEPVVCDLCAHLHLGCPQVQVHFVVGTGDGREVEVPHAVQLQLERQGRLQVPVNPVLLELQRPRTQQRVGKEWIEKVKHQGQELDNTPFEISYLIQTQEIQINPTQTSHTVTGTGSCEIAEVLRAQYKLQDSKFSN